MITIKDFTDEQLKFLAEMPYRQFNDALDKELTARFPEDRSFFNSLKVGDCFMDAQLKHMYIYKITGVYGEFVTCTEAFIDFEKDDIDIYEDIDHSVESSQEFASHTRIPESDFDRFMDRVDQMHNRIDELYTGTVCEARDIFVKYI